MEQLTLDRTWELCLEMWAWVVMQWSQSVDMSVEELKVEWAKEHGCLELDSYCFFCHYDGRIKDDCKGCPGRLVDEKFHCQGRYYSWHAQPAQFYAKLLELNKERLEKKP